MHTVIDLSDNILRGYFQQCWLRAAFWELPRNGGHVRICTNFAMFASLPLDYPSYEFCLSPCYNEGDTTLEYCQVISECFMLHCSKRYVQRSCRCARHEGTGRNGGIHPLVLNHGNRWGEYSVSHSCCFSPGGKRLHYSSESGWIPQPMWSLWRRDKFLPPAGTRTAQLVYRVK